MTSKPKNNQLKFVKIYNSLSNLHNEEKNVISSAKSQLVLPIFKLGAFLTHQISFLHFYRECLRLTKTKKSKTAARTTLDNMQLTIERVLEIKRNITVLLVIFWLRIRNNWTIIVLAQSNINQATVCFSCEKSFRVTVLANLVWERNLEQ